MGSTQEEEKPEEIVIAPPVSKPGDICVPDGTPDPKGTYTISSEGGCDLSKCSIGYSPLDGSCVEDEVIPVPFKAALLGPNGKYAALRPSGKMFFSGTTLDENKNVFIFTPDGKTGKHTMAPSSNPDMICGKLSTGYGSYGCGSDNTKGSFILETRPNGKTAIKYNNNYLIMYDSYSGAVTSGDMNVTPGEKTDFELVIV